MSLLAAQERARMKKLNTPHRTVKSKWAAVLLYVVMIGLGLLLLTPLFWMLSTILEIHAGNHVVPANLVTEGDTL